MTRLVAGSPPRPSLMVVVKASSPFSCDGAAHEFVLHSTVQ